MAIAEVAAITLDTTDVVRLAAFYQQVLGLEQTYTSDDWIVLGTRAVKLGFQRVEQHQPPRWPDPQAPSQVHLDLHVEDLQTAEKELLAAGATRAEEQPGGDRWLVFIDPAGHPFCITTHSE